MFKREKNSPNEQSFRSSRFNFQNEQDPKFTFKSQLIDNLNSKLAQNFAQLEDLFHERKVLLLTKVQRMFEENENRIKNISKGRLQDLKNEARQLRDQTISNFIDNSQKLANTKNLLRKIIQLHNFNQFESMEKIKGKKYFDKLKQAQNKLNTLSKKFGILVDELQKINQKQRGLFFEIEQLESQMVAILRRRQSDYLKKADRIQDDIQNKKTVLKDNQNTKDKKKKQIQAVLQTLLNILHTHENSTSERNLQIQNLFGGSDNVQNFEQFVQQFENLIENKGEEKQRDRANKAVEELRKLAESYEVYVQHFNKERQNQTILLQDIAEGLRNQVKTALIQKVYFQEISNDKAKLYQALKKCKNYKNLLNQFEEERIKLNKQLNKINQMKSVFVPKLRSLQSQERRKDELKKQLAQIVKQQYQLERRQKKQKQFYYKDNSYLLAKQTIQREMEEYAQRGNLVEYKQKLKDLERLEQQFQSHRSQVSNNEYSRLQAKINTMAQSLLAKYSEIINPILDEDGELTCNAFITKLSKRLSLI